MIFLFDAIFLISVALVLIYFYLSWKLKFWKRKGVDSDEKTSLIFGSVADAFLGKQTFGEVFNRLYDENPGKKVVGWYKFHTPGLMFRDPVLVRKVLVTDFNSFRNNDIEMDPEADPIMGRNIFVLKDELWKKSRALITPAFTAGKIKAMYPMMQEVAKDLVKYLKNHPEELHVKSVMSRYTSDIVARCALGIDGNNLRDSKPAMHEMGKMIFEPSTVRNIKMLCFFLLPGLVKFFKVKLVPQEVLNFFNSVLHDVIIYRQKTNIERNDLVQYLIEVKRKALEVASGNVQSEIIDKVYSDDDILSGCIMFFVEGYETSALVLNNILYHLALHKDVQDTLRDEVDAVLSEGDLTFEKLHAMNYLNSIYLESNRILPVMFSMSKVCTEKYTVDLENDKQLTIEPGTPISLPVYKIQRDPLFWEDAEQFKPERFLNKEDTAARSKGFYLPFGDGPRMCPGSRIATTIVKLAVVQIVANLDILRTSRTPDEIQPDPHYFMIGHKGGIYLKFAERVR